MARTLVITGVVVLVAALLLLLPVRIPHSISVAGRVYPAMEWTLLRDDSGALGSVLRDHLRGTVDSYSVSQFVRGDAVRVTFDPSLRPNAGVVTGDTIASIYSNETERQLSELNGSLAAALSMFDVFSTGEKESIVAEARARVARAREQVEKQELAVERLRALVANNHASAQELEFAEMQLGVYQSDMAIAQADLETAQTGAKPAQLELTRTEANALRQQIETLQDRLEMFTIRSPITGVAVRSFGPDTLLTIKDTTAFVVVMPVPWAQYEYVSPGQEVKVRMPGTSGASESTVRQFGDSVHLLNGAPVVMATAFVSDNAANLIPGAIVSCSINTGRISILQYLRRLIS